MSHCFPYPPPGYVKNGIRDEGLIESIKLQREGEKAKKKRKERKKEKKLEKKEKEKVQGSEAVESKKHRHKKRHKDDRNREDHKEGGLQKKIENEFEKSSLTEEHGHPVGSQNSSDNTLSSTKRQKLSSPLDGESNSSECLCVFPFRGGGCLLVGEMCPKLMLRVNEEKSCLSTRVSQSSAQMAETVVPSSLCGRCSPQLALKSRDVIENWVPPPTELDCTFDDKEWLFRAKQDQICEAKIGEVGSLGLPLSNSTTLPHVCYLLEADIYALPFTVPY
ncbi:uncharacterized protein LOC116135177 [Pistacia vera]|uniref:uncharacterized protein LOC116135177 n=1 Tax=Pistacia vera TaxID=55513 RepID=UPI001263D04B|nr:uncharacterized protein LOC116135177 [Pistacia vera]